MGQEVQVRKVGETVYGTVTSLATALEFPISVLKDSARPEYWVPDAEITSCSVCDRPIGSAAPAGQQTQRVHHCRQCGRGVCASCSQAFEFLHQPDHLSRASLHSPTSITCMPWS